MFYLLFTFQKYLLVLNLYFQLSHPFAKLSFNFNNNLVEWLVRMNLMSTYSHHHLSHRQESRDIYGIAAQTVE